MNDIIATSRIRIARNINGYNFPVRLNNEQAKDILKSVYNTLENVEDLEFRSLKNMSNTECMMLLEEHTISKELLYNKDISAVAYNSDFSVSIMFNEEDHIREQCILKGLQLTECFKKIKIFDDMLLKLNMAYDENLGFLTSCPTNLGTGLRASVMMFLPALTMSGNINRIIEELEKEKITVRGNYGEGTNAKGYYYQISNSQTLGLSEDEIIEKVTNNVIKIEKLEKEMQNILMQAKPNFLKDWVFRAIGLFKYAYMISSEEFFENMAKIKLGNSLGLLDIDNKVIENLEKNCCSAHLINQYGELSKEERDIKRANYIRNKIIY